MCPERSRVTETSLLKAQRNGAFSTPVRKKETVHQKILVPFECHAASEERFHQITRNGKSLQMTPSPRQGVTVHRTNDITFVFYHCSKRKSFLVSRRVMRANVTSYQPSSSALRNFSPFLSCNSNIATASPELLVFRIFSLFQ